MVLLNRKIKHHKVLHITNLHLLIASNVAVVTGKGL